MKYVQMITVVFSCGQQEAAKGPLNERDLGEQNVQIPLLVYSRSEGTGN